MTDPTERLMVDPGKTFEEIRAEEEWREGFKKHFIETAERLGQARAQYARLVMVYSTTHGGNTYLGKAAADEEMAETLLKAEALYEIAKAELHGGTDAHGQ
jgi:hypothetical protein